LFTTEVLVFVVCGVVAKSVVNLLPRHVNSFNPAFLAALKACENVLGSNSFNTSSCLGACIVTGVD
jgi:hypothetical protein